MEEKNPTRRIRQKEQSVPPSSSERGARFSGGHFQGSVFFDRVFFNGCG